MQQTFSIDLAIRFAQTIVIDQWNAKQKVPFTKCAQYQQHYNRELVPTAHPMFPPIAMAGIARFRGKRTILTTTAASAILWHCLLRWYFSRCCQVIVQSHPGSSVCTQHGRMYSWWVLAGSTAEGVIKCWVSHLLLTAAYQTSNDLPFHTRPSSAPS